MAALTVGVVPAVVLLMPIGVGTFDVTGLAVGGRATWLSRDAHPAEWVRRYVTERSADPERAAGLADGPVWLGPAPTVPAPAPEVTLRSRQGDPIQGDPIQGDTVELHVSSPRSASTVVLRVDHHVDEVTVTAPGLASTGTTLTGIRPGRWPTEVRFGDLPTEGIDVTLLVSHRGVPHQGPLRIAAYDLTPGLAEVPGFLPRPLGTERSPRRDSDTVVVARTYEF